MNLYNTNTVQFHSTEYKQCTTCPCPFSETYIASPILIAPKSAASPRWRARTASTAMDALLVMTLRWPWHPLVAATLCNDVELVK